MSTMRYLSPYHFNHSLVNIWVYIQYVKRLQTLMQFSYLPHQTTHLRYRTQCCRSLYPEITVVLSYMYFISYPSDIFLVTLELWYLDIVVLCSLHNILSDKIKRILFSSYKSLILSPSKSLILSSYKSTIASSNKSAFRFLWRFFSIVVPPTICNLSY